TGAVIARLRLEHAPIRRLVAGLARPEAHDLFAVDRASHVLALRAFTHPQGTQLVRIFLVRHYASTAAASVPRRSRMVRIAATSASTSARNARTFASYAATAFSSRSIRTSFTCRSSGNSG